MKSDELTLCLFERKISCKIYSAVPDTGELTIRSNQVCTSFTSHQILSEQLKQQGCDGQGTYGIDSNEITRTTTNSKL